MASDATGVASLAGRYAAALFDLADEQHALDAVAGDLRELRAMLMLMIMNGTISGQRDLVRRTAQLALWMRR